MSTHPFDLTGKVALVTGGNGGIGLGCQRGVQVSGGEGGDGGVVQDARGMDDTGQRVPGGNPRDEIGHPFEPGECLRVPFQDLSRCGRGRVH